MIQKHPGVSSCCVPWNNVTHAMFYVLYTKYIIVLTYVIEYMINWMEESQTQN